MRFFKETKSYRPETVGKLGVTKVSLYQFIYYMEKNILMIASSVISYVCSNYRVLAGKKYHVNIFIFYFARSLVIEGTSVVSAHALCEL